MLTRDAINISEWGKQFVTLVCVLTAPYRTDGGKRQPEEDIYIEGADKSSPTSPSPSAATRWQHTPLASIAIATFVSLLLARVSAITGWTVKQPMSADRTVCILLERLVTDTLLAPPVSCSQQLPSVSLYRADSCSWMIVIRCVIWWCVAEYWCCYFLNLWKCFLPDVSTN